MYSHADLATFRKLESLTLRLKRAGAAPLSAADRAARELEEFTTPCATMLTWIPSESFRPLHSS